jgi:microcystin degradation protein MlrC
MEQEQLSVRSTRARKLAHEQAKKEQRTVSQVVERALEIYVNSNGNTPREPAAEFWARLIRENGTDHNSR